MIKDLSKNTSKLTKLNQNLKIAIIKSSYHNELTEKLEKSSRKYLEKSGVLKENIKTFVVPGSWEIPLMVQKLISLESFNGIIAFGVIIKGETYHFELIANEVARALMTLSLNSNIPIAFEVLATFNLEQAKERTSGKFNKGVEAAATILTMINNLQAI